VIDVRRLSHRIELTSAPGELQPLLAALNQMLSRLAPAPHNWNPAAFDTR
jgi:hypothetical protein